MEDIISMKNKHFVVFVILICLIIIAIPANGIYKNYKEKKTQERNDYYLPITSSLFFYGGDYTVTYDDVETETYIFKNPGCVKISIYQYNLYNEADLSYDMLIDEFENYYNGKGSYKNLMKYADFYSDYIFKYPYFNMPGELGIKDSYQYIYNNLQENYDKTDIPFDEYFDNLSDDEINAICDDVFEDEELLCLILINKEFTDNGHSATYPLLYTEFGEDQIQTNKAGEKFVELNKGKEIYYLTEKKIDPLSDEISLCVSKIEFTENGGGGGVCVGDEYEQVKNFYLKHLDAPYEILNDSEHELTYTFANCYKITSTYENGICNKVIIEIIQ